MPPLRKLIANALQDTRKIAASALHSPLRAPKWLADAHLEICRSCQDWYRPSDDRCAHPACGCHLRAKVWFQPLSCPAGKW